MFQIGALVLSGLDASPAKLRKRKKSNFVVGARLKIAQKRLPVAVGPMLNTNYPVGLPGNNSNSSSKTACY